MGTYFCVGRLGLAAMAGILGCGGNGSSQAESARDAGAAWGPGDGSPDGAMGDAAVDLDGGVESDSTTMGGTRGDAGIGPDGDAGEGSTACGAGDPNLPPEPAFPPVCTTLLASQAVAAGTVPGETALDTARIQAALSACKAGQAVKLTTDGASNSFVSGPVNLPTGVSLWVDAGATLYASRNPVVYGATCSQSGGTCAALISAGGSNSGVFGEGVIDGQGGEPILGGTTSWWDLTASTSGASANPKLISAQGATNFTLYRITLHNSPKFHVTIDSQGFVVWGITVKTPSSATNSQGTALTPAGAHNTDGVDPGEAASDGYIVCSDISDGDDNVAIKGGTSVKNLTIAHNHFGAGHGMSIGSETNGGVSGISVYDLSIDGTFAGAGGNESGIRIKSDPSVGGPVTDVTYTDVCVRETANPILLTPRYTTATGTSIPLYTGITLRDFRYVASTVKPVVTIDGYDASHLTQVTFDNVVVDGITPANVLAAQATVTLGPGNVNFTPSGTNVTVMNEITGSSTPNACTGKWVMF